MSCEWLLSGSRVYIPAVCCSTWMRLGRSKQRATQGALSSHHVRVVYTASTVRLLASKIGSSACSETKIADRKPAMPLPHTRGLPASVATTPNPLEMFSYNGALMTANGQRFYLKGINWFGEQLCHRHDCECTLHLSFYGANAQRL